MLLFLPGPIHFHFSVVLSDLFDQILNFILLNVVCVPTTMLNFRHIILFSPYICAKIIVLVFPTRLRMIHLFKITWLMEQRSEPIFVRKESTCSQLLRPTHNINCDSCSWHHIHFNTH